MSVSIEHHSQDQEFTTIVDGYTAELAYSLPTNGVIDFTHTFVDEGLRGRGMADALAQEALNYARQQGLRVRTSCHFMAAFVRRHAEYQDILAE